MAKKARKPLNPYVVVDADGRSLVGYSNKATATRDRVHRVYKLVTLEEVAVIRAARKAAEQWKKHGWKAKVGDISVVVDAMNALADAVEASRVQGK